MNEAEDEKYLIKLAKILQDCLTGQKKKHALLVVANDETETIAMYSVNANDAFVDALLIAAKTHLEIEEALKGEERSVH